MSALSSVLPIVRHPLHTARTAAWLIVALLSGAAIAILPPGTALIVLASAILFVLSLIDLRVALIVLLTASPLKVLFDTELPRFTSAEFDIGQILLIATLCIWIARSIALRRRLDLRWSGVFIPIITLIMTASLTLWTTFDARHTLKELILWSQILLMMAFVLSLTRNGSLGWIVAALITGAVVQAGIGLYEFLGGSGAAHLWILDYRYFRAFGSFGQPNPFGAFMGLTLPLALGAAVGTANEMMAAYRRYRSDESHSTRFRDQALTWGIYLVLAIVGSVILGIGLAISWSRGAWIGFTAAALVLLLFAPKRRWLGIALVILIVGSGILGALTGLAPASLVARFSDFSQELTGFSDVRGQVISDANYAVLERFAHWQAAFAMASDHPWLGVGFGAYEVAYPQYALMNWPFALGHAHNYYINLLAETGIIGLSAYLAAWIAVFALTIRALRRTTGWQRGIALGLLGVWTHLSVHSFFDYLFVNNMFLHVGVMLGLIGGLLLATKSASKRQTVRSEVL